MRKINPVPDLQKLLQREQKNSGDNVIALILGGQLPPARKYYHWDKIRFLKPPQGLSHEQWWLSLKFARMSGRKPLPFKDKNGNPFSYVLTDEILKRLHEIDGKAKGYIGAEGKIASEETKDRYIVTSLIEEAITSSQLEGASTTRKVASEMIRSGRKPRNTHEQMIFNNYQAMKHIQGSHENSLTIDKLLNLHEILTEDTMDDPYDAGRVQGTDEERVVVGDMYGNIFHQPPAATELPDRLKKIVKFANESSKESEPFLHPVLRAIILHFIIAYDHPFVDGNGRIARALFYYSVLKSGYKAFAFISISQIIKKAPSRYGYAYQYVETDDGDVTYFIHHQLEVICNAIEDLEKYIDRKQNDLLKIERQLKSLPLNYRQLALLSHAIRHPGYIYTIKSHLTSHNCAYGTARADVLNLVESGLLVQKNMDQKTFGFIAPEDFAERLKSYS